MSNRKIRDLKARMREQAFRVIALAALEAANHAEQQLEAVETIVSQLRVLEQTGPPDEDPAPFV